MIWLTSDTHFGHLNIIKYKNRVDFLDEQEKLLVGQGHVNQSMLEKMDETFIDAINRHVAPHHSLWHLGDFAFSRKKQEYYERCKYYRSRINCRNVSLVIGNHDRPDKLNGLFSFVGHIGEIKYNKMNFVLCHYPMVTYNRSHYGAYHFYGHAHGELESFMDRILPGRRSMDVGIDFIFKEFGEYRPISIDEAVEYIEKRNKSRAEQKEK